MRCAGSRLTGRSAVPATEVQPAATALRASNVHLALPDKPSIAVLPFQNMSGDPEQEYFADGMVEDIITALSRFKSLFVIARNSSFAYKGKPNRHQTGWARARGALRAGRQRAQSRRTGSHYRSAHRRPVPGGHIWADRYDGDFSEVYLNSKTG